MSSVRYRPTQKSASPLSVGGLEGGWECHEARVSLPVATFGCAHWFEVRNLEINPSHIRLPPPPIPKILKETVTPKWTCALIAAQRHESGDVALRAAPHAFVRVCPSEKAPADAPSDNAFIVRKRAPLSGVP